MIIQCEQCQAKFRLDDSKVTDRGVKVRCAKCKHVFTVNREQPEAEPFDYASTPEQTLTDRQEDISFPPLAPGEPETNEPTDEFSFSTSFQEEPKESAFHIESDPFEIMPSDSTVATAGNDEFSFASFEDDKGFPVEQSGEPSTSEETEFGDNSLIQPFKETASEKNETAQGFDYSTDDIFMGVSSPSADDLLNSGSIDFGTVSFADSMGMGDAESAQEASSLSPDSSDDSPFSQREMEPGIEPATQVNPDEPEPSRETVSPPLPIVETEKKPDTTAEVVPNKAPPPDAGETEQDDLPPLSITSRRKQSSVAVGLISVAVLMAVGVLAYFGFTAFSDEKEKVAQETGKISIRAVKASYLNNASAGLLLVISGEALNEYPKPRAAIQVKGMIFDAKGQILASKSAFGGNILTDEQLATLPLEKIETAMANQFGDSLANLEIAPGKKVSFMIVIASPPKDGKDFGVEPTGSTVATGSKPKQ
ncbi:MAG: DUF3426 domain-containing protein [Desulfuromonadaceae bacterium]|nr:DUF3426 domain-containing protein [Desulfuromonadaceae bacterium]